MNRTEIRDLADQARTNPKIARGAFRKLAMENGFVGRSGGWIYRGEGGAVVQGWQGLADLVCYGQVTFTATEERDAQDQNAVKAEADEIIEQQSNEYREKIHGGPCPHGGCDSCDQS